MRDEDFIRLVNASHSFVQIKQSLKADNRTIRKRIDKLYLDISHFHKANGKFIKKSTYPKIKKRNGEMRYNSSVDRLNIILKEKKNEIAKCAECNKNTKILEFAHFDRSTHFRRNGKTVQVSNLKECDFYKELEKGRFLCINCHRKETKRENEISKRPDFIDY